MTFDGCFVPDQSRLARWVLRQDRGKFVRQRHEYERLAATSFSKLDTHVRHDLLRIPLHPSHPALLELNEMERSHEPTEFATGPTGEPEGVASIKCLQATG